MIAERNDAPPDRPKAGVSVGMNKAHSWICWRIVRSQASPPRSDAAALHGPPRGQSAHPPVRMLTHIRKLTRSSRRNVLAANEVEAVTQLVGPAPHHAIGSCPVGDAARTLPVQIWVHL